METEVNQGNLCSGGEEMSESEASLQNEHSKSSFTT